MAVGLWQNPKGQMTRVRFPSNQTKADIVAFQSTMAGRPFKVGRFAHTLRVRLMREHLGIDVDALDEENLMAHDPVKPEYEQKAWDPDSEQAQGCEEGFTQVQNSQGNASRRGNLTKFATGAARQGKYLELLSNPL